MATTDRTGPATEPVLPSSRQPVPSSEQPPREAGEQRNGARRRTAAEIESEIAATTERLATNVDELVNRIHPARVASRSLASVRGVVTGPTGRPRAEVVGAVVGALVGAAILVWRSRRR